MNTHPNFFISYSRADTEFVQRLASDLEDKDIDAWWDQMDIASGSRWDKEIEETLKNCRAVIVVLSPDSVVSNSVADEWSYALDHDKPVYTVRIAECDVPMRLRRINWIDFSENHAEGFEKLVGALGATPEDSIPRSGAKPSKPTAPKSSNNAVWAVLGLIAMVVGWMAIDWFRDNPYVQVTSTPANASIYVNDEFEGRTPWDIEGFAGGDELHILVEAEGHVSGEMTVVFPDNGAEFADFSLTPISSVDIGESAVDTLPPAVIPNMIELPGGTFVMGDEAGRNEDLAQHEVDVAPFLMAETEVTYEQWDSCVAYGYCNEADATDRGRGQHPVVHINWNDTLDFIDWLVDMTGDESWRLPSEAEWEYAARGGNNDLYGWGSDLPDCDRMLPNGANFLGCATGSYTVASFSPNNFGLFDMHGNVWEWVEDCVHANYDGAPQDESPWLTEDESGRNCDRRVLRGGSWDNEPHLLRSAHRNLNERKESSYNTLGFRVAKDLN